MILENALVSPVWLNYLAAIHGFSPVDLETEFNYGNLADGNIQPLQELAAAYPQGQFIRISPSLISENVPALDFLAVSPQALHNNNLEFYIKNALKNNGLLWITYPILPAAWTLQWLKEWITAYSKNLSPDLSILEKWREGLNYLQLCVEKKIGHLANNAALQALVEIYLKYNDAQLSEAISHTDWQMFHFSDILSRFKLAGLQFVGTLPISSNYAQAIVPIELSALTNVNREYLEQHKVLWDTQCYRYELYIKSSETPCLNAKLFEKFYFGTLQPECQLQLILQNQQHQLQINYIEEPYFSVIQQLVQYPHTLEMLAEKVNLKQSELIEAIQLLVLGGEFRPFVKAFDETILQNNQQLRFSDYNYQKLHSHNWMKYPKIALASPILGDAVELDSIDALLLYCLTETTPEQVPLLALEILKYHQQHLSIENEAITDQAMQLEVLVQLFDRVIEEKLQRWLALRIVYFY
jgi:hypothetical protein